MAPAQVWRLACVPLQAFLQQPTSRQQSLERQRTQGMG